MEVCQRGHNQQVVVECAKPQSPSLIHVHTTVYNHMNSTPVCRPICSRTHTHHLHVNSLIYMLSYLCVNIHVHHDHSKGRRARLLRPPLVLKKQQVPTMLSRLVFLMTIDWHTDNLGDLMCNLQHLTD